MLTVSERRALTRLIINRAAMLHFPGICGIHPCVVGNINNQGAGISCIGYYIFAEDFDLSFDGFKTHLGCHVVWRNGHDCGVEFTTRTHDAGAGLC